MRDGMPPPEKPGRRRAALFNGRAASRDPAPEKTPVIIEFVNAVRAGDVKAARKHLDAAFWRGDALRPGWPEYVSALRRGDREMGRLLVTHGAKPTSRDVAAVLRICGEDTERLDGIFDFMKKTGLMLSPKLLAEAEELAAAIEPEELAEIKKSLSGVGTVFASQIRPKPEVDGDAWKDARFVELLRRRKLDEAIEFLRDAEMAFAETGLGRVLSDLKAIDREEFDKLYSERKRRGGDVTELLGYRPALSSMHRLVDALIGAGINTDDLPPAQLLKNGNIGMIEQFLDAGIHTADMYDPSDICAMMPNMTAYPSLCKPYLHLLDRLEAAGADFGCVDLNAYLRKQDWALASDLLDRMPRAPENCDAALVMDAMPNMTAYPALARTPAALLEKLHAKGADFGGVDPNAYARQQDWKKVEWLLDHKACPPSAYDVKPVLDRMPNMTAYPMLARPHVAVLTKMAAAGVDFGAVDVQADIAKQDFDRVIFLMDLGVCDAGKLRPEKVLDATPSMTMYPGLCRRQKTLLQKMADHGADFSGVKLNDRLKHADFDGIAFFVELGKWTPDMLDPEDVIKSAAAATIPRPYIRLIGQIAKAGADFSDIDPEKYRKQAPELIRALESKGLFRAGPPSPRGHRSPRP